MSWLCDAHALSFSLRLIHRLSLTHTRTHVNIHTALFWVSHLNITPPVYFSVYTVICSSQCVHIT